MIHMKVILLITACEQNKKRIEHQVQNLKSFKQSKFTPVFVFGKTATSNITLNYPRIDIDVEERYTNLYKKLHEAYKFINVNYDFDYVCKIDDDTKVNLDRFNESLLDGKDYVGRFFSGKAGQKITIDLDTFDIKHVIQLNPNFLDENFEFATGDCYFLSKKAVKRIAESSIEEFQSQRRVQEDRLFGYFLRGSDITRKDIKTINAKTTENKLQVTQDFFSIHPVSEHLFPSLVNQSAEDQLKTLDENKTINLMSRQSQLKDLTSRIMELICDFVDSKRTIGLG
jgi:hypothetical protein